MITDSEINRLTRRNIARLLDKLEERHPIEHDIKEAIKSQFWFYADGIKSLAGKVGDGTRLD